VLVVAQTTQDAVALRGRSNPCLSVVARETYWLMSQMNSVSSTDKSEHAAAATFDEGVIEAKFLSTHGYSLSIIMSLSTMIRCNIEYYIMLYARLSQNCEQH
jgi:hypothetical protein